MLHEKYNKCLKNYSLPTYNSIAWKIAREHICKESCQEFKKKNMLVNLQNPRGHKTRPKTTNLMKNLQR